MNCPHCNTEYACPCRSCKPKNNSKWEFVNGDFEKCPGCGAIKHVDEWLDIEMQQLKSKGALK